MTKNNINLYHKRLLRYSHICQQITFNKSANKNHQENVFNTPEKLVMYERKHISVSYACVRLCVCV